MRAGRIPAVLTESERIAVIGEMAELGNKVGVMLEMEKIAPGKIKRYVERITQEYPRVMVLSHRDHCPIDNIATLTFALRPDAKPVLAN
jgi:hypothetical protein